MTDGKNVKQPRFGFVVLHYLVDNATQRCVESIRRVCRGLDYRIVVVDNDSANGSWERLCDLYGDTDGVTLVHNAANEGFARGNNTGYRLCRDELGCGYIVTVNNDAMIIDTRFVEECMEDYERTGCGVIGPDIVSLRDQRHQNPSYGIIDSHEEVVRQATRFRRILTLEKLHLFGPLIAVKQALTGSSGKKPSPYTHATAEAVAGKPYKLHGACLIFTPAYVQRFADAFDPGTFLYFEEHILAMRCRQAGLEMLYDPRLQVVHQEDASTDSMKQDRRAKQIFTLTNYLQSLQVLDRYVE
ncbi:glycosyltransferase [Bifidobacterium cuniculi]|uniref:Glycosyl transferase family protein n=1 Tax=Bifidobacterium cuniculi TaxID=1688 RepID=A0A087AEW3_9BIFI|nr:glycosyltransferase [Bifidobacterium cuniculi]KFI57313.1 glycosyl transferase family protein [Bifidobacterium cuniculi]